MPCSPRYAGFSFAASLGGKSRMVPIGERALAWVRRYVDTVRPQLVGDPAETALFINERGVPVNAHGLGDRVDQARDAPG